jgi:enolase-phosphatase E1
MSQPKFILTDIEGTTTSVSFVYEVLFPYFRENIHKTIELQHLKSVQDVFSQTIEWVKDTENRTISTPSEIIEVLNQWSQEDKKITPLKTLQGILWEEAYTSGTIQGHVYDDVAPALKRWKEKGIQLGVFSSGSIAAQKLIFGYSVAGDLTPYFSAYFDTSTGGKREAATYQLIAEKLGILASEILFLSDITEELQAAASADLQTIQLVRDETIANWNATAPSFASILN